MSDSLILLGAIVAPLTTAFGVISDVVHHQAAWAAFGFVFPPVGFVRGVMYLIA